MALFLDTQAISHHILNLIKEAKETLIFVSPYIRASEMLRDRLRTKFSTASKIEFTVIYGKIDVAVKINDTWFNEYLHLD